MKYKALLAFLLCFFILSSCSKTDTTKPTNKSNNESQEHSDGQGENEPAFVVDLDSEEGIKAYLVGKWIYNVEGEETTYAEMEIGEDLGLKLFFKDLHTGESKGEFEGKIGFDRIYAEENQAPDLLTFDLDDEEEPGGDFFFLHRTIYDKKLVLSLFFAGNGNHIFEKLSSNFTDIIEEISFEKEVGATSNLSPLKFKSFYATFWGHDVQGQSLWLDDVLWIPTEPDDYAGLYPSRFTLYENEIKESVVYTVSPKLDTEILQTGMFKGEVYFVETDNQGQIRTLLPVRDNLHYFNENGDIDEAIKAQITEILTSDIDEAKTYLDNGMSLLYEGESLKINGIDFYRVALGTDHEDHFVKEVFYAVNIYTRQVYVYDVAGDKWQKP